MLTKLRVFICVFLGVCIFSSNIASSDAETREETIYPVYFEDALPLLEEIMSGSVRTHSRAADLVEPIDVPITESEQAANFIIKKQGKWLLKTLSNWKKTYNPEILGLFVTPAGLDDKIPPYDQVSRDVLPAWFSAGVKDNESRDQYFWIAMIVARNQVSTETGFRIETLAECAAYFNQEGQFSLDEPFTCKATKKKNPLAEWWSKKESAP